ncbi:MAG TPA: DNA topoisomerase subunit B [Chthonomonadaceae bacterium]|nr:DNA topoisomerase subunit B [Chthonomonadaceae bacterium]
MAASKKPSNAKMTREEQEAQEKLIEKEEVRSDADRQKEAALQENIGQIGHVSTAYGADQIQVLEGLSAVRLRPSMYIGSTDSKGLHHLFVEVSDNAIDEAMAGHCDRIDVTLHADDSISVRDNGRGIPVAINQKYNMPAVEVALTKLHAGGKFDSGAYKVSGGLHGVGVSCVNATSDWLEVVVWRNGAVHKIGFERGDTTKPLKVIGKAKATEHGTLVRWHADPEIFSTTSPDAERIERRLRELAYLNKGVTLSFRNERDLVTEMPTVADEEDAVGTLEARTLEPETKVFHYPKGLIEYVEHLNETKDALHKPIYFSGVREVRAGELPVSAELAMQYNLSYQETILSFANNINTPDGGTHLSGFKTALTRVLNNYARKNNLIKEKEASFTGDDVREGLTCVISVKLHDPKFESQTKVKLANNEVEGVVNSIVGEKLSEFLEENPAVARKVIDKALTSQRARDAARKAAELVKRQSALESNSLPGKLADCSERDPKRCELFLVEGDSAGGPAKQGRDRRTQAILPLRGKILNAGKTRVDKVLENEEIRAMITALGTGISYGTDSEDDEEEEVESDGYASAPSSGNGNGNGASKSAYDLSKLRYDKIIIMTDADVDGDHIRTLLLTFFWHYMRPLIQEGHVYVAQPPLFRVKVGKNDQYYAKNEEERDVILKRVRTKKDVIVTRFKGLGEMNAIDLAETTMDQGKRRLAQIQIDPENLPAAIEMFDIFMSEKVEPRRDFIVAHAKEVTDVDWHG